jgi:hypothetical protein
VVAVEEASVEAGVVGAGVALEVAGVGASVAGVVVVSGVVAGVDCCSCTLSFRTACNIRSQGPRMTTYSADK